LQVSRVAAAYHVTAHLASSRVFRLNNLHPLTTHRFDASMSDSPPNHAPLRTDPHLLRQFVMEYLQQHGFDKALDQFKAGLALDSTALHPDDLNGTNSSGRRQSAGKEAIFRAPEPVAIENVLKRNIPQAQSVSASTLGKKITPEFEAQAIYIVEQMTKRTEATLDDEGEGGKVDKPGAKGDMGLDVLLDPSDRVEGYKRYRRWVDGILDIWQVSLAELNL
jgi:transcription initiation factor TFIID subunit 5